MKIKVCGMRDPSNIRAAASLDIDIMGFIFSPLSQRYVGYDATLAHFLATDPRMAVENGAPKRAGVFVNAHAADIVLTVKQYGLNCVQLHGDEDRAYVMRLNDTLADTANNDIEIIKAMSIRDEDDVKRWREYEDVVDMLLFDTKGAAYGGNGTQFDWDVLQAYDGDIPFLLSGGIGPYDVERVLEFQHERCVGIDLNSRFESAPGMKDIAKLRTFIERIRNNGIKQTYYEQDKQAFQ